jgi:hypothetical protein
MVNRGTWVSLIYNRDPEPEEADGEQRHQRCCLPTRYWYVGRATISWYLDYAFIKTHLRIVGRVTLCGDRDRIAKQVVKLVISKES